MFGLRRAADEAPEESEEPQPDFPLIGGGPARFTQRRGSPLLGATRTSDRTAFACEAPLHDWAIRALRMPPLGDTPAARMLRLFAIPRMPVAAGGAPCEEAHGLARAVAAHPGALVILVPPRPLEWQRQGLERLMDILESGEPLDPDVRIIFFLDDVGGWDPAACDAGIQGRVARYLCAAPQPPPSDEDSESDEEDEDDTWGGTPHLGVVCYRNPDLWAMRSREARSPWDRGESVPYHLTFWERIDIKLPTPEERQWLARRAIFRWARAFWAKEGGAVARPPCRLPWRDAASGLAPIRVPPNVHAPIIAFFERLFGDEVTPTRALRAVARYGEWCTEDDVGARHALSRTLYLTHAPLLRARCLNLCTRLFVSRFHPHRLRTGCDAHFTCLLSPTHPGARRGTRGSNAAPTRWA